MEGAPRCDSKRGVDGGVKAPDTGEGEAEVRGRGCATEGSALGAGEAGGGGLQSKPGGGSVEDDGGDAGGHILPKLGHSCGSPGCRPAPTLLQAREPKQPEVRVRSIGGCGGRGCSVQRPEGRPDGTVVGVPWERGGRGGGTAEGEEMREASAGMADLHSHKRDAVMHAEGESPDGRVQVHFLVDADEPGFHEVALFRWGKGSLGLGEVMLPLEPMLALPRSELDEGRAGW